jgi:PTH1 family peptidyl-tRNA hydrolase
MTNALIIGLGNPGSAYALTRHNVGFMLVDHLAQSNAASFETFDTQALVAHTSIQSIPVLLAKPQRFMNASGPSVASLLKRFPVGLENILVAYDDIDLPLERLRLLPSGGTAGHHGLESITEALDTEDFPRLRLGVGRPPGSMDPADYVLSDFTANEIDLSEIMIRRAADCIQLLLSEGIEAAMTRYNAESTN